MKTPKKIKVTKDGPYLVSGNVPLTKEISVVGSGGSPEKWKKGKKYPKEESYALCRCGNSANKPFCDGSHIKCKFDGTETAGEESYLDESELFEGPDLDLTDCESLCSIGRFCHLAEGTWKNVEHPDSSDSKENAIKSACNCPSGRLVVWDKKTGKPIESDFEQSIGITEDPQAQVSGPIWVKGGIEIEGADDTKYEKRNRVTLCRCGKSRNKPFCDGSHMHAGFNDGDESLK